MTTQVLLFDQSRSASHLLERILSQQEKLEILNGTFSECRGMQVGWLMSETWDQGMPKETEDSVFQKAKAGGDKWKASLNKAGKEGKIILLHDHPFSTFSPSLILDYINNKPSNSLLPNGDFTLMPTGLLLHRGTVPILTIRDPRLAVPSAYRVLKAMGLPHGSGRPNFLISTAALWNRMLFNFFKANGIEPLVVDADDIMTSKNFMKALSEKLGLSPDQCIFEWDPVDKETMHPMQYASQKYLMDSTGVDPGRAAKILNLDAEVDGWEKEFGEDVGLVKEAVERATEDYRWLWERRVRF